jgi:type IV secretion system protein VirD4
MAFGEKSGAPNGDQGPYLGSFAGNGGAVRLRYKGPKHLLTFGPPGANKSAGLVVPNIAHLPRSLIVIDPKGQLAAITAQQRASLGRVIVLNPFGVFADKLPHLKSAGWNPLLQLDPASPDFAGDAVSVGDALIEKSGGNGGNSKFFETSAENLVTALAMWERHANGDKADFRNIRLELASPSVFGKKASEPIAGLLHTLKQMSECDFYPLRVAGGRAYARLTDANSQSTSLQDVIDTILKELRFLDDPRMAYDMSRGAIDFGALHREITTIYLILPVHELTAQAKWLRLFVNLALRSLYKSPPTFGASLPPVMFMLDEFAHLGRLEEIVKALGASRDYSIQLWMFLQNFGQLKQHYKDEWAMFFTGAGAVTSFAPRDWETAEHLAKMCGDKQEEIRTDQTNTTGGPRGGSVAPQAIPLVRPEDLMRLERGHTLNLIEPCPWPLLARVPVYSQTPYGVGLDPNPYYRG